MNYAHSAFNFIMKEPDNKQCMDCGAPNPTFGSINNGVVVCERCASYHKLFGTNISWVKSLVNDTWADEEVMFIQISGNKRFISLMKEYNLSFNQSIEYKYSVVAADYYRNLLFCELNNREKPVKPDTKTGQMLIQTYLDELSKPKPQTFFGKVDSMFSSFKTKITEEAKVIDQKYDISGKAASAYVFGKQAGEKIVEKGKEISQNPTVKDLTKKTEEGLYKVVDMTKKALNLDQNNQNQIQQGSNMQYNTQSAQYYDPNTTNQPLLQNQGYSNINNQQYPNTGNQGNIYPTFSNAPEPINKPKQV